MKGIYYILTALAIVVSSCSDPNEAITPEKKPDNPSSRPQAPLKCIPVPMEEFRELYHPTPAVGVYINDHAVFAKEGAGDQDADKWNLIGITNHELDGSLGETHFAHGVGYSLEDGRFSDNPANGGIILNGLNKQTGTTPNPIREGTICWAPHVVYHEGLYHMFYFSILTAKWNMEYATSTDLINWKDRTSELSLSVANTHEGLLYENGNIVETRDPMVLKYGSVWLMYTTAMWLDGGVRRGAVAVYQSTNLKAWTFKGYALRNLEGAPIAPYSTCESPFVIYKDGKFILSTTITVSDESTYHDTIIFVSDNPYDFGTYSGATMLEASTHYAGRISAHCPEYIYDKDADKWYVTTAGWTGMVKHEGAVGGVGIAEMQWMTPAEYEEHRKHFCDDHKSAVINHSFENGTLDGWTKTGQFGTHMINDSFRSRYGTYRDMVGKKTFCSYADNHNGGDGQTGSMRSNTFIIGTDAKMSFYIAGGNDMTNLYVALTDAETGAVIFKETGHDTENSRKITWDLSSHAGKKAYVEVVDNSTAAWGHIGVDCILVDGTPVED